MQMMKLRSKQEEAGKLASGEIHSGGWTRTLCFLRNVGDGGER